MKKRFVLIVFFLIVCSTVVSAVDLNVFQTASDLPSHPKAATLEFIQVPSVTAKYIMPGDNSGATNFTIYSFSTNYEVNYTLDIYAYYEPITYQGIFDPISAYLLPNGTWIIVAEQGNPTMYAPATILVGVGSNASNLVWHSVGKMNASQAREEIAVAGNGTAIRVAYLERNATGYVSSSPIKWVNYFASDDYGATWTNGTLWDCSESEEDWCPGITLAAYGNTFECMWAFANCSTGFGDKYNLATVWESRDQGTGWSQAKNLTALEGNHTYRPQAFYNQNNGLLYVAVNNFTEGIGSEEVILELGAGPDSVATDTWSVVPTGSWTDEILAYCALDYEDQKFYFVNITALSGEGIWNASTWKGTIGDPEPFPTEYEQRHFNIFAKGGPKLFSADVTNVYGLARGGLMDCESPFFFARLQGTLPPAKVMMHIFNGKDPSGSTHNASAYLFSLLVERDWETPITSKLAVSVDRRVPELSVNHGNTLISPLSSPGYSDVFSVEINASKHGTGVLTIDALEQQVNGSADVADGLYSYERPSLCGNGRINYLFYMQEEGNLHKLMVSRTDTAGISWSTPLIARTFEREVYELVSMKKGNTIYVWLKTYDSSYNDVNLLLISSDEANSFIPVELPVSVIKVTPDLSCWNYTYKPGAPELNISRSTDLGHTWSLFLKIPQNGFSYNSLSGVAYDPVSGNFSFLVTNNTASGLKLVIANDQGNEFSVWENLSEGQQGVFYSPQEMYNIDMRKVDGGISEWIITTNNYGSYSLDNYSTYVAYRTTRGDGIFSDWLNFTGISGEIIPVTVSQPTWTILFPENATPCVATCVPDTTLVQSLKQVRVFYGTSFVYSKSAVVAAGTTAQLDFFGTSNAGQPLPEGSYSWRVTFTDLAGQSTMESGTLEIDNTAPVLDIYANLTTPDLPDPRYPLAVTVPSNDLHLSMGLLRYRTTPAGVWTLVPMGQQPTGPTSINFTATIPAQGDVIVYWEVVINDSAGNTLIVSNGGQSFTYARANLRLQEEVEPPPILDLSGGATLEVRVFVPEDAEYMDYVFIQYHFDDGMGIHSVIMDASGGSIYNYTFTDFPQNASLLEYTIIGVDIYGNQVPLGRLRTISLLPALPAWELSGIEQVVYLLISLVVGVVCGVVYSSMIRQRTGGRILTKEMVARVVQESREQAELAVQDQEGKKSPGKVEKTSLIALALGLTGGIAGVVGAAVYILVYRWPEAAMLCLTGTMLAMVFLWILTTNSAVRHTLRANKAKMPAGEIFGILLVGLTIFGSVIAILYIGTMVSWWRVRVNEQAYHLFGLEIPRMITTLTGTFFSSIILLTWSVGKDVTKTFQELQDAEVNNENPGRIIALREARMANILGAVGWKGVLFIAIIGATLIFASDLSVYAPQGLLIIIPFVVGAVVTLAVVSLQKLKTSGKSGVTPMFFDRVSKCPACGAETPVGGAFCENCGAKVIIGERVKEGQYCPACNQPTTIGVKHCRYCGNTLKTAPSSPTQQWDDGKKLDPP